MPVEKNQKGNIEIVLREIEGIHGEKFCGKIRPIIYQNSKSGRIQFFLNQNLETTLQDYVIRVTNNFLKTHIYINGIQVHRSAQLWEPLFINMQKWGYNVLRKYGLIPGETTQQLATDCATDAAITLMEKQFPYDTEFDPWAFNFVKFACLKAIERETKKSNQITEVLYQDGVFAISRYNGSISSLGIAIDVINAYLQLTAYRRKVIYYRYECGLCSKEIAIKMKKNVSAVDKLHFDAIRQLREKLDVEID
jgi:DNA-directed RNA polymerase specialized sigma24 family protein